MNSTQSFLRRTFVFRHAFINPELLHATAFIAVAAAIILPIARTFHWHPLLVILAIFGIYGLAITCLNFQNLKEDFLTWLKNKK